MDIPKIKRHLEQQDRREIHAQRRFRPGWDDNMALLERLAWRRRALIRWESHPINANIRDVDQDANWIASENQVREEYKKWYMETNGKTEAEYEEFMGWLNKYEARKHTEGHDLWKRENR